MYINELLKNTITNDKIRTYDLNSNRMIDQRIKYEVNISKGLNKINLQKLYNTINAVLDNEKVKEEETSHENK